MARCAILGTDADTIDPMTLHPRNLIVSFMLVLAAAALAGCATQSPRTRASAECWMSIEKSHPEMSLDRRADIVNKCIDDKMKGQNP